ncbi:MAG: divalent-cation tolerance protein CutA [Deltaproteobacteria bacterium]|nr:divalent-cation tolerance protein CutA [Deltaproteobacteria bacterium]|tara:strand:+ start:670 stop:1002 length:333 start_codon:yes stop_codon:yes gene_type:complete
MPTVRLVFMTAPDESVASSIAREVVDARLAACANLLPGVRSIYRWEGEICDDGECLVLFKTTDENLQSLRDRIISLHPYECPEVLAVDVAGGSPDYMKWVLEQVSSKDKT